MPRPWSKPSRVVPAPALPHYAAFDLVGGDVAEDDLLDEAAQQGLFLAPGEQASVPDLGQPPADVLEGGPRGISFGLTLCGGDPFSRSPRAPAGVFALLGPPQLAQSILPSPLQLCGHKAVVGIGPLEAPAGEFGLVAQALELLLACMLGGRGHLLAGDHRLLVEIQPTGEIASV